MTNEGDLYSNLARASAAMHRVNIAGTTPESAHSITIPCEYAAEVERLRAAVMKLDGYWITNRHSGVRNVMVRADAFAELCDLVGLKVAE